MDYMKELLEDGKDIRNAHYVCPVDLNAAHQVYINRRQRAIEHQAEMELLERIDEYNESYYKHVERFKDIIIKNNDLVITPLPDVYAFYVEGKALHHCVFTSQYFKHRHDLILSARIGDKHLETIQVDLDNVEIQQCHGLCNENSEYHDDIIDLMNANMTLIKKRINNRRKQREQQHEEQQYL
jgi:deoxyadenosine/deoxycytidine kinase